MSERIANIANAGVIIACLYFLINGVGIWGKIGIIMILLFALSTWGVFDKSKEQKELTKKQLNEIDSRIRLNNSNSAFITANALLMREQALQYQNKRSR